MLNLANFSFFAHCFVSLLGIVSTRAIQILSLFPDITPQYNLFLFIYRFYKQLFAEMVSFVALSWCASVLMGAVCCLHDRRPIFAIYFVFLCVVFIGGQRRFFTVPWFAEL